MALKTLDVLGPQHGYGLTKRIEQISGDLLSVNQGTLSNGAAWSFPYPTRRRQPTYSSRTFSFRAAAARRSSNATSVTGSSSSS